MEKGNLQSNFHIDNEPELADNLADPIHLHGFILRSGLVFDLSTGINKSSVLKLKDDIKDMYDRRKDEIYKILNFKIYSTISGDLITEYHETLESLYKNNSGYNGWLICVIKDYKSKKSKKGYTSYTLSFEDLDGKHNITFWENIITTGYQKNMVYGLFCEVIEYFDKFTMQKEKKFKLLNFEKLLSK